MPVPILPAHETQRQRATSHTHRRQRYARRRHRSRPWLEICSHPSQRRCSVSEEKCPSCGGVTLDRKAASVRLADYFKRERGASSEEADRRADEIMTMLAGGGIGALTLAPVRALAENW